MPWAFRELHRTLATKSWRHGALTGLFVALQMLSCIYYGVFLVTLLGLCGVLLLVALPARELWPSIKALVPGALLAALLCGAYAVPYMATKAETGGRSADRARQTFSARASSYLVATPDNVIWGDLFARPRAARAPALPRTAGHGPRDGRTAAAAAAEGRAGVSAGDAAGVRHVSRHVGPYATPGSISTSLSTRGSARSHGWASSSCSSWLRSQGMDSWP